MVAALTLEVLFPAGRGLGEELFQVEHCLAAPHPGPLPDGEREQ